MAQDEDFDRLMGWIGRYNSGVDLVSGDHEASKTMIDSVEYELDQLRRQILRDVRSRDDIAPPTAPGRTPEGVFNVKLRDPENVRNPDWWAALGLNR